MRYLFLSLTLIFSISSALAQTPKHLDYQGILRDEAGEPIANQAVTAQFSILEGSTTGAVVYTEEQSLTSNAYGLIQTKIGSESAASFATVDWSQSHFIKVEVDLGSGLQDFGTSELSSVPYALYGEDDDSDPTNEIQNLSIADHSLSLSNSDENVDLSSYLDNTDDQELSLSGSELSISGGNAVDLGVLGANTDEQTLSVDGTELSISDGNTVDLSPLQDGTGTDAQELTLTGSDLSISGGNTVDLSTLSSETGTDDQSLTLTNNTLSLEDGGEVDLSAYLDNTDTQLTEEEVDAFVDNNGYLTAETDDQAISLTDNTLTLEDGGSVDLSGYLDNSDTQLTEEQVDAFVENNGYLTEQTDDQAISLADNTLTLEDGGSVDLSGYLDNTDTQLSEEEVDAYVANNGFVTEDTNTQLTEEEVDDFVANNGFLTEESDDQAISLDGNILTLEDGGTVDLSAFLDDTDTNTQLSEEEVDDFVANNGFLTEESDDQAISLDENTLTLEDGGTVDLSSYLDNTDAQTLDLNVDNYLSIQNGGTDVDLNRFLDNTDDQSLTLDGTTLTLENGGSVDLSPYAGQNTDSQQLTLADDELALQNGGTVDLSGYLDNTDAQTLDLNVDNMLSIQNGGADIDLNRFLDNTDNQALTLDETTLTLEDGGSVDLTTFLDNSDEQTLAEVLSQGADANATAITNLADPTSDQDAATKAYVDTQLAAQTDYNEDGNINLEVLTESEALDINYDLGAGDSPSGKNSKVGQSFRPTVSGILTKLESEIVFPSTATTTFKLYEGAGYGGTELYSQTYNPPGTSRQDILITFNEEIELTANSTYTWAMEGTDIQLVLNVGNPYSAGTAYYTHANGQWDVTMMKTHMRYRNTPETMISANDKSVGIGTDTPDASAALEVSSTDKGLLIPRMTTAERDAISSPADGLMIYNTENNEYNYYDGTTWSMVGGSSGFTTISNITSNSNGTLATDDFLFGSPSLNDDGNTDHDKRMFFDKSNGAFRAGVANGDEWNSNNIGYGSIAFGNVNEASGNASTAFGSENTASGFISTAFGGSNTASGFNSTTFGSANEASGNYSTAFGRFTTAHSMSEVTIGHHNTSYTPVDVSSWNLTDRLFVIGNGTGHSAKSDALIVYKNGNAGLNGNLAIGKSTAPDASSALEVSSTTGGLLMPRMTTTERDAISSPADGLMIYNTTTGKFEGRASGAWVQLH